VSRFVLHDFIVADKAAEHDADAEPKGEGPFDYRLRRLKRLKRASYFSNLIRTPGRAWSVVVYPDDYRDSRDLLFIRASSPSPLSPRLTIFLGAAGGSVMGVNDLR